MPENSSDAMLEARAIHLWRGDRHLLRGVSFGVNSGELLQVIGPNGVGKSTLLRVMCGLLPVESGDVACRGQVVTHNASQYQSELAYLAHANALKGDLTAAENLRYELSLRRAINAAEISTALALAGLTACAHLPARVLSAGQRRRLALTRVLLCKASLWILDEPTTNLDAAGIELVERLMEQHLASGGGILAAAHHSLLSGHAGVRKLELAA